VDESTGNVFVSQYVPRLVTIHDTRGTIIRRIGATSSRNYGEAGFFNGPAGVAVIGNRLIVTDPENNRFQVCSDAGSLGVLEQRVGRDALLMNMMWSCFA
jgi:hypothetical protein